MITIVGMNKLFLKKMKGKKINDDELKEAKDYVRLKKALIDSSLISKTSFSKLENWSESKL